MPPFKSVHSKSIESIPSFPLESITLSPVLDIVSGKLPTWNELSPPEISYIPPVESIEISLALKPTVYPFNYNSSLSRVKFPTLLIVQEVEFKLTNPVFYSKFPDTCKSYKLDYPCIFKFPLPYKFPLNPKPPETYRAPVVKEVEFVVPFTYRLFDKYKFPTP